MFGNTKRTALAVALIVFLGWVIAEFAIPGAVERTHEEETQAQDIAAQPVDEPIAPPMNETEATAPEVAANPTDDGTQSGTSAPKVEAPVVRVKKEKPLQTLIPAADALRAQVEADPHSTPKALLGFSAEIGRRMEKALASENDARSLFNELETCVDSETAKASHSLQGVCLLNAGKIAKAFPALESDLARVTSKADPRAVELTRAVQ